jgi:hypothetical protein
VLETDLMEVGSKEITAEWGRKEERRDGLSYERNYSLMNFS